MYLRLACTSEMIDDTQIRGKVGVVNMLVIN